MDESNLEAEHAVARRLVDQLGACVGEIRQGGADVLDLVRDVMHSRAAFREETADRRVLCERAQKLQPALADPDRRRLDSLLLDTRPMLEPRPEKALVGVQGAVEIVNRETDVVHRAGRLHGGDRI